MEKMGYVEITGLAYKLREINSLDLPSQVPVLIPLNLPTGSMPGFVEMVIHNKNHTKIVNIPFDTFISFPKTKTNKVLTLNYHSTVCTKTDNPPQHCKYFQRTWLHTKKEHLYKVLFPSNLCGWRCLHRSGLYIRHLKNETSFLRQEEDNVSDS